MIKMSLDKAARRFILSCSNPVLEFYNGAAPSLPSLSAWNLDLSFAPVWSRRVRNQVQIMKQGSEPLCTVIGSLPFSWGLSVYALG